MILEWERLGTDSRIGLNAELNLVPHSCKVNRFATIFDCRAGAELGHFRWHLRWCEAASEQIYCWGFGGVELARKRDSGVRDWILCVPDSAPSGGSLGPPFLAASGGGWLCQGGKIYSVLAHGTGVGGRSPISFLIQSITSACFAVSHRFPYSFMRWSAGT